MIYRRLNINLTQYCLGCRNSKLKLYLCTQVEITEMKKERETANKYRQQALEGDLMAMNNMGVCYAQGIGVVEDHVMAFQWYMKAALSLYNY